MMNIQETAINIVAEGTRIEGKVVFDRVCRVHGTLTGDVSALDGSTLILGETAVVEGTIHADTLMIDGFVKGDITARGRVVVSRTGRVIGNIRTSSLLLETGAYFEGRCFMDRSGKDEPSPAAPTLDRSLKPA